MKMPWHVSPVKGLEGASAAGQAKRLGGLYVSEDVFAGQMDIYTGEIVGDLKEGFTPYDNRRRGIRVEQAQRVHRRVQLVADIHRNELPDLGILQGQALDFTEELLHLALESILRDVLGRSVDAHYGVARRLYAGRLLSPTIYNWFGSASRVLKRAWAEYFAVAECFAVKLGPRTGALQCRSIGATHSAFRSSRGLETRTIK
ncbi:hypothetical protein C8F01DRAFT_1141808 [Mycena amicta]|nr:hypothetical protein C8F01DRAFT_1141808 [Mycena amicta]